jgi:uncharacterized caspase-like protein
MRRDGWFKSAAFSVVVSVAVACSGAMAQQVDATKFNQSYDSAVAKARQECATLWSDHAFDPLRDRINFSEDKPPLAMLTNTTRLHPKEKRLADLAIKMLERCRTAWAPAYALLPPQVNAMIQGVERRQDALIAELYVGKITFGEFNVGMDRISGELARALSGIPETPQIVSKPAALEKKSTAVSEAVPPRSQPTAVNPASTHEVRVALVIGDSNYSNLPKLANPENDARAIADLLKKMGFSTRLVLNASEQDLRREVRKFAGESDKADIALVFYAGHGAQVNGENYVLPVDIDIPRTESDIQLTGLKVDDLVNSIRAKTKVVFLDACRDNPVLFKNLVRGRGAHPTGLAPAVASNLNPANPGGGVFIAYATDAGSVALEGEGKHSPFTQALLKNLTKPISIDDMFSLVTKEVRLVTKNSQRPYKYASLENIVCLSGDCSTAPASADTDVFQQAKRSEAEDLQIALQTKNPDALEAYIQKYPESAARNEVLNTIATLKRSAYDEWTLFEVSNQHFPVYLKLNSLERFGDKAAVRTKYVVDPAGPIGHQYPDAAYADELDVFDCKQMNTAAAEITIVGKGGQTLHHYKWADPQFLDLSIGSAVNPGTVVYTLRNIVCYDQSHTPLFGKKELASNKFTSLSSTVAGDGDVFFVQTEGGMNTINQKDVIVIFRMHDDHTVYLPPGISFADVPTYRTEIDRDLLRCDQNSILAVQGEEYDASNNLVYMSRPDHSKETVSQNFVDGSPFAVLQRIVCKPNEAQQ